MSLPFTETFRHHGKRLVVFRGTKGLDFLIGAGLLAPKLFAGIAHNHEPTALVFFVDGFQRAYCGV